MSENVKNQDIFEIKKAPLGVFSIQIDKSTDILTEAQLLAYVRNVKDFEFKEEFIFCQAMESTTRGNIVERFLREKVFYGKW